ARYRPYSPRRLWARVGDVGACAVALSAILPRIIRVAIAQTLFDGIMGRILARQHYSNDTKNGNPLRKFSPPFTRTWRHRRKLTPVHPVNMVFRWTAYSAVPWYAGMS